MPWAAVRSARVVLRTSRGRHMLVWDTCRISEAWQDCINPPVVICAWRRARCENDHRGDGASDVGEQMCRSAGPSPRVQFGRRKSLNASSGTKQGHGPCHFQSPRSPKCVVGEVASRHILRANAAGKQETHGGRVAANRPQQADDPVNPHLCLSKPARTRRRLARRNWNSR